MVQRSRFSPSLPAAPGGRKLSQKPVFDLRGLNSTDPYDILEDHASPYLRNARMYDSEVDRQVAISTRKGVGFYSTPIGEASDDTETSVTGAADQSISTTAWIAQKFTAGTTGRLTKVEVRIKTDDATGPVIIKIYDDNSGEPGTLLATTSVLNSDLGASYAYEVARLVEAPTVTNTEDYWIVAHVQAGNTGNYSLSSTTNSTDALTSGTSGNTWSAASYSLNFKTYVSTDGGVINAVRYNPKSGSNETIFAHEQNLYTIDDSDGSTTSIKASLDANATKYRFAKDNDKIYIANGYDSLMEYNGTTVSDNAATTIPSHAVAHENRIFIVKASDPTRLEFSNRGDDTTWESTSFIYIISPNSSDPITALVSFQDSLVIFKKEDKYVLYGEDLGNFDPRQALGKKGAVSQEAVISDENYIYFVSDDGIYRWNGSKDEKISRPIQADLDDIADINDVRTYLYEDRIYFCFQSTGGTDYDAKFIYDTDYDEWFYDDGTHVNDGIVFEQEDGQIIEFSDKVGALYYGDQQYSQLGKPINFIYHTNYFNFGYSDNDKQVRRLYLHLRSQTQAFSMEVGVDQDFADDPTSNQVALQGTGDTWGSFVWGTGTWGQTQYKHPKINVPGRAVYFQLRLSKDGVNTPVDFIGYNLHYRLRRPR